MDAEQEVKAKWPDAEVYIDFGGGFAIGVPSLGVTVGDGKPTLEAAWADAASRLRAPLSPSGEKEK